MRVLAWSDAGAAAYLAAGQRPDRILSVVFLGLADRYAFPQPLLAGAAFTVPILVGASLRCLALRGVSDAITLSVLASTWARCSAW